MTPLVPVPTAPPRAARAMGVTTLSTLRPLGLAAAALLAAAPASAHFLLAYTPEATVSAAGDLPLALVFWHPMENGPVMDMERPRAVYALHRGERIDLSGGLEPFDFFGAENVGRAFRATLPVRRLGDYVVAVESAPYYEASEDIFIQQFAKAYVNRGGLPTDWSAPLGLPAEIAPMNRPTNILAGSTFTGRVLSDGAPAPGAEIEIEYMSAVPLIAEGRAAAPVSGPPPGGALVAIADEDGYFTFGVPKAGYWGFAALGVGPETEHEGKRLSQDAVIWIRAYGME